MNKLVKGLAFDGQVRLIGAMTKDIVQKALNIHKLSPVATAALGKLLTAGTIMGSMMKNDTDRITIMLKGDGPLGNVVVCGNSRGDVKGYVSNPFVDVPLNNDGSLNVGEAVGKNGVLTVIKDIGLKEPQVGSIKIINGEITDEIIEYFLISEQVPTVMQLGVAVKSDVTVSMAGGYLLQLMPNTDSAIIDMIVDRISHMKPICQLLKDGFSIEEILKAVSGDDRVVILDETNPDFACDCKREKMKIAQNALSKEEREEILKADGFIEMKCSFCGRTERWYK